MKTRTLSISSSIYLRSCIKRIATSLKKLAAICAITGLLGWGCFDAPTSDGVQNHANTAIGDDSGLEADAGSAFDDTAGDRDNRDAIASESDSSDNNNTAQGPSSWTAFVVTTDYSTGAFTTIDPDTLEARKNLGLIHFDAVARYHDGLVYVLNRFGQDNVQVLDPADSFATIASYSTGNGSNPQDIVFPEKGEAIIARLNDASLLIMDLDNGSQTGTVSLGAIADSDGLPEPAALLLMDANRLVAACGRLDQNDVFSPTDYSALAIIDIPTMQLLDTKRLLLKNPTTGILTDPISGDLLIGSTGAYGVEDGGVERLAADSLDSSRVVVSERQLGGDIISLAVGGTGKAYALVQDTSYRVELVSFSLDESTTSDSSVEVVSSAYPHLWSVTVAPDGKVWVADRDPITPGIRIFDPDTGKELTSHPIDTGLPPFQVLFLQ